MNRTQVKSLKLRIEVLEAELAACTTAAMHASVYASLDAAWRQLQAASR